MRITTLAALVTALVEAVSAMREPPGLCGIGICLPALSRRKQRGSMDSDVDGGDSDQPIIRDVDRGPSDRRSFVPSRTVFGQPEVQVLSMDEFMTLLQGTEEFRAARDEPMRVSTRSQWFVDQYGVGRDSELRTVMLRGVNLGGSTKLPSRPYVPTHHTGDERYEHRHVSFVDRPFPLSEADEHFARLREWGFNVVRLLTPWEAIEHEGPGIYDQEYIAYVIELIKVARAHDIKVFLDPHQDVWSRFSGGSGAPGWTLEAAGFNLRTLHQTGAAVLHNEFVREGVRYPKMIWPTNVSKMAAATMFTLFLAGNTYAPNTMVDGIPIQDFLQSRYIQAFVVLAQGIQAADATLWDDTILGFDTMNEPNGGFIGTEDIRILPKHTLKKGAAPTFLESARACMGMTTRVKKFSFGLMGIRAKGTTTIRPEGASCWLPGRNVWLNEGVHDEHGNALLPEYFSTDGDADAWMQRFWLPFAERFSGAIRKVVPDAIIFAEGEAVRAPPRWPDAARQNVVFSPHYYDGLTLMQKQFRMFNADGYAVVKGENPIRSLGFGYAQVTDALTRSLKGIKEDGMRRWGMVPCLIGEIGIPFDMHNRAAYTTDDYTQQWRAMEANMIALERNLLSYTIWNYSPDNTHEWGDGWNGEDLSIIHYRDHCPRSDLYCHGRALPAIIRPFPIATAGIPLSIKYRSLDTKRKRFTFRFFVTMPCDPAQLERTATVLFVPRYIYGDATGMAADTELVVHGEPFAVYIRDASHQKLYICSKTHGEKVVILERV